MSLFLKDRPVLMNKIIVTGIFSLLFFCHAQELRLSPGAVSTDGILQFQNKDAYAEVPDSQNFAKAGRGITLSASVKLRQRPPITGSGFDEHKQIIYQHDIIVAKGRDFVFGRRNDNWVDQLYCNFHDGSQWAVPLQKGVKTPPYGQWAIWSMTMEPRVVIAEGKKSTLITMYLNGEQQLRMEVEGLPRCSEAPVRWGKGTGIQDETWGLAGEVAEMQLFERVLDDDEVMALAQKSKLVKISAPEVVVLSEPFLETLAGLETQAASPLGRWAGKALRRAAGNGYDQKKILAAIPGLIPALQKTDAQETERLWNQACPFLQMVSNQQVTALIATGNGQGAVPLLGVFEHQSQREVFGQKTISWELDALFAGEKKKLTSSAPWTCVPDAGHWTVTWELPEKLKAISRLKISDNRIEMDLEFLNPSPDVRLENVSFPLVRLSRKQQGTDYLVHPSQSGVLYRHPVSAETPRPSWYPCGFLNMQFGAYYDDLSGVYVSPEDARAGSKEYTVRARSGDLEFCWNQAVPHDIQGNGGNALQAPCSAAVELFSGNWYDAALCYKRFARNRSSWCAPDKLPTPSWFEENTLWFSHWTFTQEEIRKMPGIMGKLRQYFAMPFAVHWYRWYDTTKGGFPHFIAKDGVPETLQLLRQAGVRSKAYIDTRLWSELDGPDRESDMEFSSIGRGCAIINADGSFNYERYSKKCREVVMCPAAAAWQKKMYDVTARTAALGFDMIYHDQVSASRPFLCFSKEHGHPLNSPAVWGTGYDAMFQKIHGLSKQYPELCHNTEDAADAHMKLFNGFMPWRWTDDGQIPLFVAVYGGYTQFSGREYDHTTKGDPGSFFVKAAGQLINAEQIGWFTVGQMMSSPERIVFVKQLAYLRKMLLPFFNRGDMLKPLDFVRAPEMQTLLWGVSGSKPRPVTLPEILHGVWQGSVSGSKVVVWVNTAPKTAVSQVQWKEDGSTWYRCRMDGTAVMLQGPSPELQLPAYAFELWCNAPVDTAKSMAEELKRLAGFSAEELLLQFNILSCSSRGKSALHFDEETVAGAYRGKGCIELKGNGEQTIHHKIKMSLAKNTRYRLRMAVRKESAVKGYLAVSNYSPEGTLKFYATGGNVPADNQWHDIEINFSTDASLNNCGLYLYNEKSQGKIFLDEVSLEKVAELPEEPPAIQKGGNKP